MSSIPNSAMPHAKAHESGSEQEATQQENPWTVWASKRFGQARDAVTSADPKLLAAVAGALALAILPALRMRRRSFS